jgi:WD40 repeat protein
VIILWRRLADGLFQAVYHTATVQASNPTWVLAAFSPAGRRVAVLVRPGNPAGQDEQPALAVYDLATGRVVQTFLEYRLATWFDDEDLLAVEAQYDTRLTRINAVNGQKTVAAISDNGAIAYSPNGNFIAQRDWSPSHDERSIAIRKWQSGDVVAQVPYASASLLGYRWSPDGHWFAITGGDGTLRIWPVTTK